MRFLIVLGLLVPAITLAHQDTVTAKGFHWYSPSIEEKEPVLQKPVQKQIPTMEPYDELLSLRRQTLNKLAESLLRPSVESTQSYIEAQTEMAKRHQAFVRNWQRVLLTHPELDHRLHFPTDNNAIANKNDEQKVLTEEILQASKKQFGLIFIYHGNSSLSRRFANVFLPFVKEYQFSMIPVSVTDEVLQELPYSKHVSIEQLSRKIPVKARFLPAVMLVNLKTKEMSPLSYGFVALTDLKARFLDVATDFKRFSYEGLGEAG